jgi:hypothetical protein
MRRRSFSKLTGAFTGLLASLLLATLAVPAGAESARESHPLYDVRQEVTISGTVGSVLTKPAAGTIPGPHLTLNTATGQVDASLGKWGLTGQNAPSIKNGESIVLTGVMKTVKNKEVFVVRTVKANGHIYAIRNEHGVPVSPQAREHANQVAQKGEGQ